MRAAGLGTTKPIRDIRDNMCVRDHMCVMVIRVIIRVIRDNMCVSGTICVLGIWGYETY